MSTTDKLAIALMDACYEISCPTCHNAQSYLGEECPECHGEHRNANTIGLLKLMCAEICGFDLLARVMLPDGIINDGVAR